MSTSRREEPNQDNEDENTPLNENDNVQTSAGHVLFQSCSEHAHGTCACACSVRVLKKKLC